MKREIKFKRYHFDSEKKVIKVTQWGKITKSYRIYEHSELSFTAPSHVASADTFIDCQFTGLKDIHGREIYQDDIYIMGDFNIKYRVVWHDSGFMGNQIGNTSYAGLEHWKDTISIIGNIFENPEILKK